MKKGLILFISSMLLISGCSNNNKKENDNININVNEENKYEQTEVQPFPVIDAINRIYNNYVNFTNGLDAKTYSYQDWLYAIKGNHRCNFETFEDNRAPSNNEGKIDDLFINTENNEIYQKNGFNWVLKYSMDYNKIFEVESKNDKYSLILKNYQYDDSVDLTFVFFPSKLNDVSVFSVGSFSSEYFSSLKAVYISEGIVEIEKSSFENRKLLEYIYLPSSLKKINDGAFSGCSLLNNVNFNNVEEVDYGAFEDCYNLNNFTYNSKITNFKHILDTIKEFTIPSDWTEIPSSYFDHSKNLETIIIPSNIKTIGGGAFYECTSLKNVIFEEGLTKMENSVFKGCTSLTTLTLPDSLLEIGTGIFSGCSNLEEVVLPKNLKVLNSYTFNDCFNLKYINLQNVEKIMDYAFLNCKSLISITIPKTVNYIFYNSFNHCDSLEDIVVDSENETFDSRDNCNAIIETALNKLICGSNKTIIPNSVEELGTGAFCGRNKITSIVVTEKIKKLPADAFIDCINLQKVVLPENFVSFGDSCFCNCEKLENIDIPSTVTHFYSHSFEGCIKLKNFNFGFEETTIDGSAFKNCTSLTSLYIPKKTKLSSSTCFEGCYNLETIVVEDGNTGGFYSNGSNCIIDKNHYVYTGCKNSTFPDSVDGIHTSAFKGNPYIKNVNLKNCVDVCDEAFRGCSNLETVQFDQIKVEVHNSYGSNEYIFADCPKLKSVMFSASQKILGWYWFANCINLESINLQQVEEIYNSFTNCSGLKRIHIPATLKSISNGFQNCSGLEEITVDKNNPKFSSPDGCNIILGKNNDDVYVLFGCKNSIIPTDVTEIKYGAFYGCVGLKNIVLPRRLKRISSNAFAYCSSLTSITIPENVEDISYGIFEGCNSLTTIKVDEYNPYFDSRNNCNAIISRKDSTLIAGCNSTTFVESIIRIGNNACCSLNGLTSIRIPDSVIAINYNAFSDCTNIKEVFIPSFVKRIGSNAFSGIKNAHFCFESNNPIDFYYDYDHKEFCDQNNNIFHYNVSLNGVA